MASDIYTLSKLVFYVSKSIWKFAEATGKVDDSLKSLVAEVDGFKGLLDGIASLLTQPDVESALAVAEEKDKLLSSLDGILSDCTQTVEALGSTVAELTEKSPGRGVFKQVSRTVNLKLDDNRINMFKSQIRSHSNSLQLVLQSINILVTCSSADAVQSNIDTVKSDLSHHLSLEMDQQARLFAELLAESRNAMPSQVQQSFGSDSGAVLVHKQRLQRSADAILSDAGNIIDKSPPMDQLLARATTVPGVMPTLGSSSETDSANGPQDTTSLTRAARIRTSLQKSATGVFSSASTLIGGRSMSDPGRETNSLKGPEHRSNIGGEARSRIESWISPSGIEETFDSASKSTASDSPHAAPMFCRSPGTTLSRSFSGPEMNEDYDTEDEVELEVAQKSLQKGHKNFEKNNFAEAETLLQHGLDRAKVLSQRTKSLLGFKEAELRLAVAKLHQGNLNESEETLLSFTDSFAETDRDALNILYAAHNLSLLYAGRSDYDKAVEYGLKAVKGRRRSLGKDHPDYYDSLNMLASVHSANGDKVGATAYVDLVPPKFRDSSKTSTISRLQRLSKEKEKDLAKERAKQEAREKEEEKQRAKERKKGKGKDKSGEQNEGGDELEEQAKSPVVVAQEWAAQSSLGHKALVFAASRGQGTAVKVLVERGAKLEPNEGSGRTPLIEAASEGHKNTVELLVEKGANIEARDNEERTALIAAALRGKNEVVQVLLDKAANTEARDKEGYTALILAAQENQKETVQMLIEKKANIEAQLNNGKTALQVAKKAGHKAVVLLLKSYGAKDRSWF